MEAQLAYFDCAPEAGGGCTTGVSLHSQTLFSRESALPLGRLLDASVVAKLIIHKAHRRHGANPIEEDLSRIWWTPPLTPRQELDVEARQIEDRLGLNPIVSNSDHDAIDAPLQLQVMQRADLVPVSVEWTVPYRNTYFHVGIHNAVSGYSSPNRHPRLRPGPKGTPPGRCSRSTSSTGTPVLTVTER